MMFRALDSNLDWTFGRGKANYLRDALAVAEHARTRLGMLEGDCFFDATGWIDWLNLLGSREQAALLFSVRSILMNTQGVDTVEDLGSVVDANRALSVIYALTTVYGTPLFAQRFEASDTVFSGISKSVNDILFTGETTHDVDVSSGLPDARRAIWLVYDVDNGYLPVLGAAQPISATVVRITIVPGPTGTFRLVGIS